MSRYLDFKKNGNGLDNYIKFEEINTKKKLLELEELFLFELEEYSKKDNVSKNLKDILSNTKNKFKIKFYKKIIEDEECYLVILMNKIDNILMKLGNKYGFPRGFPIIWIQDKILNMYGFYPKFNNDKDKEDNLDKNAFNGATEINFNFKYSGFLGQIIAFKINTKCYWTTCSKNATSNEFSDDITRLIETKMTNDLLNEMCSNNIHFCGETMSKNDQVHGAEVNQEDLVVTLVSKGHWLEKIYISDLVDSRDYNHDFLIDVSIKGILHKFIEPFSQEDLHKFCMMYNLSVDKIFNINSNKVLTNFMIGLNKLRNFINLETFIEYLNYFITNNPLNCSIKNGNISHENILGNILEGLIIKVNKISGLAPVTIKYKFPFYTSRTFLLREYLNPKKGFDGTWDKKIWDELCKNYLKSWVVEDDYNGKKYWKEIFEELFKNNEILTEMYRKYSSLINTNTKIAKHIFMMDRLFEMICENEKFLFPIFDYQQLTLNTFNTKNIKIKVPIIFVFGPIGAGKSTISSLIENYNPELFKHIDGDILDLSMEDVLNLGSERNEYTIYKIVEQIIQQKIPVISIGGGVLLSNGRILEFKFFNYLNEIFEHAIEIESYILLPMNNKSIQLNLLSDEDLVIFKKQCGLYIDCLDSPNCKEFLKIEDPILFSLKTIYDDKKIFESAIKTREYTKTQIESIKKATKSNFNIVIRIISLMNFNLKKIIFYPIVNTNNYNSFFSNNSLRQSILDIIGSSLNINRNSIIVSPKFMQKRLLSEYILDSKKYIHHVTLKYSRIKSLSINNSHNNLIEQFVNGHFYKCYLKDDIDKIDKILEIILSLNRNKEIEEIIETLVIIMENYIILDDKKRINKIRGLIRKYVKTPNISLPKFDNFISLIIFPDYIFKIPNLSESAHITVSSLKYSPFRMKEVAKKIKSSNSSEKIIELDDKIYTFNNYIPIDVKFIRVFYI